MQELFRSLLEIDHYYTIFKRYEEQKFDFIRFAHAIGKHCEKNQKAIPEISEYRYDFQKLESIYLELKSEERERK